LLGGILSLTITRVGYNGSLILVYERSLVFNNVGRMEKKILRF